MVQVTPQLKMLVVYPHRVIQVQLAIGKLHPKFGHRLHPLIQRSAKPAIRVATRHRRRIQLQDTAHIQRLRRGLQIQEKRIKSG
jgi:hypothetical protein